MFRFLRTTLRATCGLIAAAALVTAPALARDSYVQDGASLFGASTIANLNSQISAFHSKTGKEVVVVTVPSLNGATAADAAEKTFASQQVNGVLVFLSKAEKQDGLLGDRASHRFFPDGFNNIRQAMRGDFRSGDYDGGITTGVGLVIDTYNGHTGSLRTQHAYSGYAAPANMANSGGGGMSIFWLILILVAGFLIIRAIFRAISRPRTMPPGYGGPGPGMPGMPMGGPGYGGGYGGGGFGGGGGGFFSGLLGGLGGAFIGNELFGRHDEGNFGGGGYNDQSSFGGGNDGGNAGDSAGWQSDPGQADVGNGSFGDFGGGGGGDFGGGGDSGGGGW